MVSVVRRTRVEKYIEREVVYSEYQWGILKNKRELGVSVLEYLYSQGIRGYIFGSVARGDVHIYSDIEIVILEYNLLSLVDVLLSQRYNVEEKEIVQATPKAAMKVIFHIENNIDVVVPVVPLTKLELDFYRFGGIIALPNAKNFRVRVPGIDKRLCLIKPTSTGHIEFSVIGRESEVARILSICPEIIEERKIMLMKRDSIGRTGVYISIKLSPYESIQKKIIELKDRDPIIKRMFRERGVYF